MPSRHSQAAKSKKPTPSVIAGVLVFVEVVHGVNNQETGCVILVNTKNGYLVLLLCW